MSMMTIAILLVVRHRTGSYGLGGAASAVGTLTQAFCTPIIGRLVDRRGQSAVLPGLLVVFLAGIALLVGAAGTNAPTALLFVGAAIAGAGQLPYPSLIRSRWAHLLGSSPQMSTALALESAADEAIFVAGPLIVTGLYAIDALIAPIVAGALALIGTIPFLAARSSEPPPFADGTRTPAWRVPALWIVIVSSAFIGIVFGNIEVAMVAFAHDRGASGLGGALVGLVAFGSLLGGLWYGTRSWRSDVAVRYRVSTATLALGSLPAIAATTVPLMAPAALLIGVSIAPTLIASSALVARVVPASARTEGFTWQSTGINVGVATGAALGGALVDAFGTRMSYVAGPVSAGLAALVAFTGARLLAARPGPSYPLESSGGNHSDRPGAPTANRASA